MQVADAGEGAVGGGKYYRSSVVAVVLCGTVPQSTKASGAHTKQKLQSLKSPFLTAAKT